MLDTSPPRELDQSILKNVDLIKPNAREAEFLTGIESEDRASARSVAQRLIAEGAFKSWQSRRPTKEICSFGRMVNHWRPGLFYTHGAISQSPTGQSLFTIDRVGLFPTRKSFVLFSQSQPSLTAICRRDP